MLEKDLLDSPEQAGWNDDGHPPIKTTPLVAGGWATATYIAVSILGALLFIPLARLLEPADFGLFTEASIVYSGLVLVIEVSLIRMLVRAPGNRDDAAQATLWLSIGIGSLGMLLCGLAAWPMAAIYDEGRLIPVLLLLAPGVLAAALKAVPHALLSRQLDFRRRAWPETISVVVAAGLTLAGAWLGAGVYSLVIYSVTRLFFNCLIAWLVVDWRPSRRRPSRAALQDLLRFGLPNGGGEAALYARYNVDYAIGGRVLGAQVLGIYSTAWNAADRPALLLNSFFENVGYATFARLAHQTTRLRAVFLSITRLVAAIALPGFLLALPLRQELVSLIFGVRWQGMVEPLWPLLIVQALWVTFYPSVSLVLALGHSQVFAIVNVISLILTIGAILIGVNGGATGLAVAMLVATGTTSLFWSGLACYYLRPTSGELWDTAKIPLLMAFSTVLAATLGHWLVQELPIILRLGITILAGLGGLAFSGGLGWPTLRQDIARLREKLPEAA